MFTEKKINQKSQNPTLQAFFKEMIQAFRCEFRQNTFFIK